MEQQEAYFKTITEIEAESGRKFIDLYNDLLNEGKSQTEIAMELKLRGPHIISSYLFYNSRVKDKTLSDVRNKLEEHGVVFHFKNIVREFPAVFNMEYEDFLREKYFNEKLSISDLASLMGTHEKTIRLHLKEFGIKKNMSEARRDAIDSGKLDYKTINSKSRTTRNKSKSNSLSQEYVHGLVQEGLTQKLVQSDEDETIEIITSLNEWSILRDKEVDIPIIIIDIKTNTFRKYSIEFQGQYFHQDEARDERKSRRLQERGWTHFTLEHTEVLSNLYKDVNTIVDEIVEDYLSRR